MTWQQLHDAIDRMLGDWIEYIVHVGFGIERNELRMQE
jgi:hypothetical protein